MAEKRRKANQADQPISIYEVHWALGVVTWKIIFGWIMIKLLMSLFPM